VPDLINRITNLFPGKRVVIAGDLVADQFLSGSISRVSREAPVFILRHEETETRPGGAANAAANVASLGGMPILVGVTADDENGRLLRQSLESAGVNCGQIVSNVGGTTTTKVRVLAGQSYSVKQQVIRIDYENSSDLSDELRSQLIENLANASADADAIVISDYGYGVVDKELFEQARQLAQQHSIPLIVDSRTRLREFGGATSATPNQEEVEQLLGPNFSDADCQRLCEELGFDSLLVTCGNKGMVIVENGKNVRQFSAIGSTEPVDVTGAGDTVIAAYSLGLASGLAPYEAAAIANHAGGIVVMKKGTATADLGELIGSLRMHNGLAYSDSAA
jgi:ADP-heptose synthase, bifunctional sugar kinase/adenylyltransferase